MQRRLCNAPTHPSRLLCQILRHFKTQHLVELCPQNPLVTIIPKRAQDFPFLSSPQCNVMDQFWMDHLREEKLYRKNLTFLRVLMIANAWTWTNSAQREVFQRGPKTKKLFCQSQKMTIIHHTVCYHLCPHLPQERTSQCGQFQQQRNVEHTMLRSTCASILSQLMINLGIYLIIWWDQVAHLSDRSRSAADNPSPAKRAHHCKLPECDGNHTRHRQSIRPNLISDVFSNWIWSVF